MHALASFVPICSSQGIYRIFSLDLHVSSNRNDKILQTSCDIITLLCCTIHSLLVHVLFNFKLQMSIRVLLFVLLAT